MKSKNRRRQTRSSMDERLCLRGIMIAYVLLAVMYVTQIPVGRQPDEGSHLQYIACLADEHRFPVFQGREVGIYEAHQPPLYYLLCVPTYWLFHSISSEASAYAARFLSLLAGLGIVYLTWCLGKKVFPHRPGLSLAAAGFVALLPMHLNVSASASNDALGGLLSVLVLAMVAGGEKGPTPWKQSLLLGLLIGLGLLTKSSCLLLLPLVAFAFAVKHGHRSEGLKKTLTQFSIVLVSSLIVSGLWLARNTHLYGDPFVIRAFNEGFKSSPHPSYFLDKGLGLPSYVLMVTQVTFMTFWGIFGEVNTSISRLALMYATGSGAEIYSLFVVTFAAVTALSMLGLLRALRVAADQELRNESSLDVKALLTAVAAMLLVLVQYIQFNTVYFQAQARYLHPMIGAIACLLVAGVDHLPADWARKAVLVWAGAGLVLSSLCNLTVWL